MSDKTISLRQNADKMPVTPVGDMIRIFARIMLNADAYNVCCDGLSDYPYESRMLNKLNFHK